ncbi:MAG: hypothetical protein AAGF85_16845 [Bacteroidota bacterium]
MDIRLDTLKKEMSLYLDHFQEQDWDVFEDRLSPVSYKKGDTVFPASEICKKVLFIVNGILASEYQAKEDLTITRFFKSKGLCSNIVSLFNQQLANDRIFAITNVEGVLIPYELMLENYLYSNGIGIYFRKRLLEILLEDKQFMSMKTVSGLKPKLTFLQEDYPEVILDAPWKYIANFMGVTPEWLSRNLQKKKVNADNNP